MGIKMAERAMELLGAERSRDEELLAVVEMDCCAADGIQYITGCTFGKGNLVFRDYGKVAATFFHRGRNAAVRLCLKPGVTDSEEMRRAREEPEGWKKAAEMILNTPVKELFSEQEVQPPEIPTAQIHSSVVCAVCGEAAMATRIVEIGGAPHCIPCSKKS